MVFPAGVEPTAPGLGILCSIQLSYENAMSASIQKNISFDKFF